MQVLDVVQLKIKYQFEEKYNFVEALVVPGICSPLKNGNISAVKQNMEFVSELDLADFEDDESTHESGVGTLIGVDDYFNFFLGKILRDAERFRMVIEWTNYFGNSSFTSVCFETHSMRCNIENIVQVTENVESVLNKF